MSASGLGRSATRFYRRPRRFLFAVRSRVAVAGPSNITATSAELWRSVELGAGLTSACT